MLIRIQPSRCFNIWLVTYWCMKLWSSLHWKGWTLLILIQVYFFQCFFEILLLRKEGSKNYELWFKYNKLIRHILPDPLNRTLLSRRRSWFNVDEFLSKAVNLDPALDAIQWYTFYFIFLIHKILVKIAVSKVKSLW